MPLGRTVGERWPVPVEVLRAAAAKEVARTSIRVAAGAIGVSQTALHRFVRATGSRPPYDRTYAALRKWYVSTAKPSRRLSSERVEEALSVLVETLPPNRQEVLKAELRHIVAQAEREERSR